MAYNLKSSIFLILVSAMHLVGWSQDIKPPVNFTPHQEIFDKTELLTQIKNEYAKSLASIEEEDLSQKQASLLKKTYLERYNAEKTLIESKNTILSGELYDFVNEIFQTIINSNSEIDANSKLVLFRDRAFNAFTLGDNIVFVNIGLIYRFTNRDQLALVIAHEIAHNTKNHSYKKILETIKLKTDSELNAQIKKISNSQYGQVSALNELLIPTILELKEQSRNHEFEADSLGLVYFINAGFSEQYLDDVFEIMEHADHAYETKLIDHAQLFHLEKNQSFISRYGNYSNSSSLGEFSEEEDELEPYLRSHPYEIERLKELKSHILPIRKDPNPKIDSIFLQFKYYVEGEMVYSALGDGNYSDVYYYSIRMRENYPNDNYSSTALSFMFSMLSYYKTRRVAGKFIDLQNPLLDEVINRSNYFLVILNPEECLKISENIKSNWIKSSYKSILLDLTELSYDFHSKNYESMRLRMDLIKPVIKFTLLENSLDILKEDPLVKGKL